MFKINDFVVYPGHGVGKVTGIDTKQILGQPCKMLRVTILNSNMHIIVPAENTEATGLRKVVSKEVAEEVLQFLGTPDSAAPANDSWSRRYREYMELVKSGDLMEVAKAVKALVQLQVTKELSFGERKMLQSARDLVKTEIDIALGRAV